LLAALAGGAACSDGDNDTTDGGPCPTELTWSNFGDPFLTTWCTGCHSSTLPDDFRGGAPLGVNFDTLEGVRTWSENIANRTYGSAGGMPPAGEADDLDLLEEWITCGMPGEDLDPPFVADCAEPVAIAGSVSASAGSPCAGQELAIDGDLVLDGDTDLSCVCDVTGSVAIVPGSVVVSLPALRSIGADLTTTLSADVTTLSLPALATVTGMVELAGVGTVRSFELPALVTVGGDFVVTGSDDLVTFDLPRLETVGGSLAIYDLPELVDVTNFTGVTGTMGGSVTIADVPKYTGPTYGGWSALLRVESVGGTITIERTGFREIAGFQETQSVGGSVVIRENDSLEAITGFFELAEVGSRIEIADNPALTTFVALASLVSVGTTAEYPDAGVFLVDLPSLVELDTFGALADVDALEIIDCDALTQLRGFDDGQLRGLTGGLRILGNDLLGRIDALDALSSTGAFEIIGNPALTTVLLPDLTKTDDFTLAGNGLANLDGFGPIEVVEGDLSIDANMDLTSVDGFSTLQSVSGSVYVTDNPELPTEQAEAFANGIPSVGGTVVVSGNGP
jgi:hypothetical protein